MHDVYLTNMNKKFSNEEIYLHIFFTHKGSKFIPVYLSLQTLQDPVRPKISHRGERKLRRGASRDTTYRMIGVDMILIEGGAERQELDGVVDGSVDTESVAVWRRPERWSQLRCRDQWRPSQL
jgi:hypothetical protein